ncbi:MAG: 5,10-methylene tetrahydromethanopterin reductase [Actinomycetales bacterium]|nr:MAG: 5,10-methylene tetrahydromethanopterin reductase [Actinomycetales bacterium]
MLLPLVPSQVEQATPFAALAAYSGALRLWQGQSLRVDAWHTFAALAGAGLRTSVGVGVSLMPLRHPAEAAMQARSIAATVGHPIVAGFGPGGRSFQAAVLGRPYASPIGAAREYLRIAGGLIKDGAVEYSGKYFSYAGELPSLPTKPISLGLGVLRPAMAKLAGAEADAAITWMTPASYVSDVIVPAVAETATDAGRPRPRIVAMVPVALARRDRAAHELALASNAPHLQAEHYLDMLRRAGADVRPGDLAHNGKAAIAAKAFLTGDLDEVLNGILEFKAAGVDEIVLNVTGLFNTYGPRVAVNELQVLLDHALRTLSSASTPSDSRIPTRALVSPIQQQGVLA